MPMVWPVLPTYRAQPSVDAYSTETRGHRRWQHVLAILRMLTTVVLEDLPQWHTDHAGIDALGLELFIRLEAKRQSETSLPVASNNISGVPL